MTTPDTTTTTTTTNANAPAPRRMDARLRAAFATVVVAASLFAGVAAFAWSLRASLSIVVGGALAVGNLYVIARIVLSLMPAGEETEPEPASAGKRAWSVLALFKMILLFGGVWLLMKERLVDPIPLLVGFGALPIGIAIGSVVSDRTAKT